MNWKTTVGLLVIVLALGLYLKFFETKQLDTAEAERQSHNVVNIERDKISGFIIQNGDEKVEIRKQGDKWRLEAPIKDQADPALIQTLFSDLDDWQKEATISAKEIDADKNRLGEYGLNKPKLKLKLLGEGAPAEIWFGKDAALEGKMYIRFENSKESYLVGQSVRKSIDKKPEEFRDKRLTDLTPAQVARVVLKTNAGEMELQKTADHWEIVKPLRARGDDQKINDLIAQITNTRIEQFVASDAGDLHPYGLAEPRGSVTLFEPDDKQGQMLQLGTAKDKEQQVYARFAARGFVYTLPKKIEEIFNSKPDDLRDRHLVRIDTNILDRITIESPGKGNIVLARKQESWTIDSLKNAPANSTEVRHLIDTLQNEQVAKFVDDTASNLAKYGLDKPQVQVTFSSFASENTPETKAGEHPFATLTFGKIDGANVYARLGDEPFIVAVRQKMLDEIFTDPLQWKDLTIFDFKPEQVRSLSVTTDKESSLERGENKQWRWTKGEGPINEANVQSLINSLSHLHAVRWMGATTPLHGLDKPQLTITISTGPNQADTRTLKVGAASGNGMWFASVDNGQATFVLSAPDLNAMKVSLVGQASASPMPSPTQSPVPTATP